MTAPIMFCCVRANPISTLAYIQGQEAHAKRTSPTAETRLGAIPGTALSWSILDGAPLDYVAAFQKARTQAGARERGAAAIGIHLLVSVSKEYIEEAGDVHDPANPRNRKLFTEVLDWAHREIGGVFAARMDLDEEGSSIVDVLASPVFMRTPRPRKDGSRRDPVPEISIRKMLKAASKKAHEKRSYSALQTLWANHAAKHLDRRIRRGIPQEETGTAHLSTPAFRQLRAQLDQERAQMEGMRLTAASHQRGVMEWQAELTEKDDQSRRRQEELARRERRLAEAEIASSMMLQANLAELTAARKNVKEIELRLDDRAQSVKAQHAKLGDREARLLQAERYLEARRSQEIAETQNRLRRIEEREADFARRIALHEHEASQRQKREEQVRREQVQRQELLAAEEQRLVIAADALAGARSSINELCGELQRHPAIASRYPKLLQMAADARETTQAARPSRIRSKGTKADIQIT